MPPLTDLSDGSDRVPPREGPERVLAELFADVLGAGSVGRHDDFFRLGGHSLNAVQLISRIRTVFRTDVSLRLLFAHPTIAELVGLLHGGDSAERPIPALTTEVPTPTSFAQQRLWFLQEANPPSVAYNMVESFRLTGPLDTDALSEALRLLADRHAILRTRYTAGPLFPLQVVDPDRRPEVELTDLSHLPPADRPAAAEKTIQEVAGRPYDLARGPVFRTRLLRLDTTDHLLVFGMHHIAGDGWSVKVLLSDLSDCYRALIAGRPPGLPELTTSYAEYAAWERDTRNGDEAVPYWREQLADAPLTFDAPTDLHRPAVQSGNGGVVRFRIPADVTEKLVRLAHQHRTTLFTTVLAAYHVLLSRWSGQRDILVGIPVAGRTRTELERLVGFFVNTVPVRGDMRGDPTFAELLDEVKDTALSAYAHQELPFERLVESINPERGLGANPLVQVTCQLFEDGMASGLELEGLTSAHFAADSFSSRFDLSLDLIREDEGLTGELVYNADLFMPDTVSRLADWYGTLLAEIVENTGCRVSALRMGPPGRPDEGGVPWSRGETVPVTQGPTVVDAFREQARRGPERVAVVDGSAYWTFAEVALAVEEIGETLRRHGVARGETVVVAMGRSAAMVAAVLGVMAAGAVVLPLAPGEPAARLRELITRARVRVLVTDAPSTPLSALVPHVVHAPGLRQGTGAGFWAPLPSVQPPGPDDAAYLAVVPTPDGPSGVVLHHRALANAAAAHETWLDTTEEQPPGRRLRSVLTAEPGSDAALSQLLWLVAGHELHVVAEPTAEDGAELLAFARRNAIDVLPLAPHEVEGLVAGGLLVGGGFRPSVFVLGGEALGVDLWGRLAGESGVWAVNLYGPTEFTVDALAARVGVGSRPVLGRPVANCRVLVVDGRGCPVPVGVAGEICVAGPQLAVGYVNDPGRTARQFVANPFPVGVVGGERMYRTGDLGRFTWGGDVEFLGRVDRQVKIRGYRVEPAEVEAALLAHGGVDDAFVTTRADRHGTPHLIAYAVPKEDERPESERPEAGLRTDGDAEHSDVVGSWQAVFEDTHRKARALDDAAAAAVLGWEDSFTGRAIPAPQMAEWVTTTTDRIRSLAPSRVLEIGAGTGLLMRPLCERSGLELYAATDISAPAVEALTELAEDVRATAPDTRITVGHAEAVRSARTLPDSYDTVIVNSVAQYFPSLGYLERVVEQALSVLRPGGHIFLGDLRNDALLEAFHSLRQHLRAPDGATPEQIAAGIGQAIQADGELSVDPLYFTSLLARHPDITAIEIAPRRGASSNEMSMFRYDAVLHTGCAATETDVRWTTGRPPSLRRIEERLGHEDRPFGYRGVANARLTEALRLRDTYGFGPERPRRGDPTGLDPETLWLLGDRYDWTTRISWGDGDADGTYDVSFTPAGLRPHFRSGEPLGVGRAERRTGPARGSGRVIPPRAERVLDLSLREHLSALLPAVMLPREYVFLDHIPRTGTGDVRIPRTRARFSGGSTGSPVGTGTPEHQEETAVDIIARVLGARLGLDGPLGHDDDFFATGGDSLTAAMSVRDLRRLDVRVSVGDVFAGKSPAALARRLREREDGQR
ncbi:condensation domain-containing protein [Streptomyces scopuliridis]|uniref:non-ribosomal peptide synthetase n=1 Tax=Streptomyces scopuliridis TaxID=452529 RepID=UPI003683AEC6